MTVSIRLHDLTAGFFAPLNAEFSSGMCHVVWGVNGIGKSTLLKIIAGLLPLSKHQGSVEFSPGEPRMAYFSQAQVLLPWLNVLDNVLLPFRFRGEKITQACRDHAKSVLASSAWVIKPSFFLMSCLEACNKKQLWQERWSMRAKCFCGTSLFLLWMQKHVVECRSHFKNIREEKLLYL